jgi:hypothetical protein
MIRSRLTLSVGLLVAGTLIALRAYAGPPVAGSQNAVWGGAAERRGARTASATVVGHGYGIMTPPRCLMPTGPAS